jgi:hypothetical protein
MKKLLSCAICMLLMVSLTFVTDTFVNAEDPPGGNPALTWNGIFPIPEEKNGVKCVYTTPCLEQKCYRWDVTYNEDDYKSFMLLVDYAFGYCNSSDPPNPNDGCAVFETVLCAEVTLHIDKNCFIGNTIRELYVIDACTFPYAEPIE